MSKNVALTPKQEKALAALLSQPTIRDAAKAAKVGERQLWRWLRDPRFSTAYQEARAQLLEATLTALQSASGQAVQTLREVMSSDEAQASAKVSAARTTLEYFLKANETLDTEARLQAIEQQLNLEKNK